MLHSAADNSIFLLTRHISISDDREHRSHNWTFSHPNNICNLSFLSLSFFPLPFPLYVCLSFPLNVSLSLPLHAFLCLFFVTSAHLSFSLSLPLYEFLSLLFLWFFFFFYYFLYFIGISTSKYICSTCLFVCVREIRREWINLFLISSNSILNSSRFPERNNPKCERDLSWSRT